MPFQIMTRWLFVSATTMRLPTAQTSRGELNPVLPALVPWVVRFGCPSATLAAAPGAVGGGLKRSTRSFDRSQTKSTLLDTQQEFGPLKLVAVVPGVAEVKSGWPMTKSALAPRPVG